MMCSRSHILFFPQLFIPAAMDELKRVDVINQQAKHGREADFKLGTDQEIAAKVCQLKYRLDMPQPMNLLWKCS